MTTTKQPGFAPAASPLASTTVHTPEERLIAGETSIPTQGDTMPAYHARPKDAEGPLPIVIVVQEIFGVHEHIRDLCRRLALEAILPSRRSSISARAIRMILPTSPPLQRAGQQSTGCAGAGRSRPRRQLGGA